MPHGKFITLVSTFIIGIFVFCGSIIYNLAIATGRNEQIQHVNDSAMIDNAKQSQECALKVLYLSKRIDSINNIINQDCRAALYHVEADDAFKDSYLLHTIVDMNIETSFIREQINLTNESVLFTQRGLMYAK